MSSCVEAKNLTYKSDGHVDFQDLSFDLCGGKCLLVSGLTLTGGDSLTRVLTGIWQATSGKAFIFGKPLSDLSLGESRELRRNVGISFSSPVFISNMTLLRNITLPLQYHNILPLKEAEEYAGKLLTRLGCNPGQMMTLPALAPPPVKVIASLARQIIIEPKLMIVSNPFSELDRTMVRNIIGYFKELKEEKNIPILLISEMRKSYEQIVDEHLWANGSE